MYNNFVTTLIMHECSKCGMVFSEGGYARRHVGLAKCAGATVTKRRCGIVKLPHDYVPSRKRQAPGAAPSEPTAVVHGDLHGNVNSGTTVNDQSVHINTLIVVTGDAAGDVVRAGSALESELIRTTILQNAELRRMLRTIENAPSAIFRLTKGTGGPRALRNVRLSGRRACELREGGPDTVALLQYCKRTAVQMVEELRRAVESVTADSPPAVREWAADVTKAMRQKLCGNVDYPAALQLYCEASSRFYKLPGVAREVIAGGVRDIGRFVAETAEF